MVTVCPASRVQRVVERHERADVQCIVRKLQMLDMGDRIGAVATGDIVVDSEGAVRICRDHIVGPVAAEDRRVVTVPAVEEVVVHQSGEHIRAGRAEDGVVAEAAFGILDRPRLRGEGDDFRERIDVDAADQVLDTGVGKAAAGRPTI